MTASTDLRALLLAAGAVTALVGQRVRFDRAEQSDAVPYIVLSVAGTEDDVSLDGTVGASKTVFLAQIFADQFVQGEAIAVAVKQACHADQRFVDGPANQYLPDLDITVPVLTIDWWDD